MDRATRRNLERETAAAWKEVDQGLRDLDERRYVVEVLVHLVDLMMNFMDMGPDEVEDEVDKAILEAERREIEAIEKDVARDRLAKERKAKKGAP